MESANKYIAEIITTLQTGSAREHAYRPAFSDLMKALKPELKSVNDPARSEHGAPDFVFLRGDLTVGYTETKDIGVDLNKVEKSEQMQRYFGYSNLILTDYLEFRFFRNGDRYCDPISIATLSANVIVPRQENYELLERTIKDFLDATPEKIKSGERLAKIMGGKARRIRENVVHYIEDKSEASKELRMVYGVMKKLLVHDMTPEQFSDMYAQTLVYGLFVARYHDETPDNFTRQEARDLVPASNPLLRHFFDHIAGADFDKRLSMIVNELCEIFSVADVRKIMEQYYSRTNLWGETKESPDPVIHFYEDFLKEYDSQQRIRLGAFYTPLPVVRFIVRSVDAILKKEFNLSQGLADTEKIEITKTVQGQKRKEQVHEVQILDPAVGTGTFLNEVIRFIHQSFEGQQGRWASYVDNDLLPRLHGFELMMAPYTIAHLKLGMTLREMGYNSFSKRLGVYLTNSLEEGHKLEGTLFESIGFMNSIAEESIEASKIKNEKPIMVVLGNPPYSVSSSNKAEWIQNLIKVYKKDLGEQNVNALSDDYVKFIRFAEHFVEKNGKGVVAMITNNAFLDGIVHRQMRKHLLETFDDLYILNLHGSTKRKKIVSNGGKDENVFDIQQGVSISIFVRKTKNKTKLGRVHYAEMQGLRKYKYEKLNTASVDTEKWSNIEASKTSYFFVPKDFEFSSDYIKGFSVNDLFKIFGSGVKFRKDNLLVKKHFYPESVKWMLERMQDTEASVLHKEYDFSDTKDWELSIKRKLFKAGDLENVRPVQYRPFDIRYTYYPLERISEIIPRGDSRMSLMKNLIKPNIAFITSRQFGGGEHFICFLSKNITEISSQPYAPYNIFPIYLYHDDGTKTVNFNGEILEKIKSNLQGEVKPEDVLDYIYAVLHSPSYREKYKEFLKIDFPRVPYPKDNETFWRLVKKGRELRALHLMESPKLREFVTTFPESGSNVVEKLKYEDGKVYINEIQYFGNVSEIAWNFYIGGYQPAQKWLKDRKSRTLSNQDLEYYQKIIVALKETDRIMKEIDENIDNTASNSHGSN